MDLQLLKDLIRLGRPHQYTKNLFVFLPALFAFKLNSLTIWLEGLQAFIAFSLIASSVYIFNDWMDKEEDKLHPKKKYRPIAAGRVDAQLAIVFMLGLLLSGCLIGFNLSPTIFFLLMAYVILNIAYSIKLKHIPLIDVSVIAIGFVLRLLVGATATSIELSHWIIVMTFLLALFLALAKRRDDVLLHLNTDNKPRPVIDGYSVNFLTIAMAMVASIVIVAYILWSISPEITRKLNSENLYLTAIFVVLGVLRYLQITIVKEESGTPSEIVLTDHFIQLILLGWIGACVWVLYIT